MNLYILDDPDLQHCRHIVAFILLLEIQGAEHCNKVLNIAEHCNIVNPAPDITTK